MLWLDIASSTNETDCPASALSTSTRFRCIDFIVVGVNCPTLSGPSTTGSPTGSKDEVGSGSVACDTGRLTVYLASVNDTAL